MKKMPSKLLSEFYSDDDEETLTASVLKEDGYFKVSFKENGIQVGYRLYHHMFEAEEAAENYVLGE